MNLKDVSTLQRSIWLDQQFDPDSPKYNIGGYAIIDGKIDVGRFKEALSQFAEKHCLFRSTFTQEDGIPKRLLLSGKPLNIEYFKESELAEAIGRIQKDFGISFDLSAADSLHNVWLIEISPTRFLWYTRLHHLIADGYSFQLLFNEVGEIYEQLTQAEPPTTEQPTTARNFNDHVLAEQSCYTSKPFERSAAFWREKYCSFPELVFPHTATEKELYAREMQLSANVLEELNEIAKAENISVFHLLLTAFTAVLNKFYHVEEINFGTPIFNRGSRADRKIFGPFINLLPLQVKTEESDTLLDIAQRIKRSTFGAYRHQQFQQSEIIKAIGYAGKRLYDFRVSYEDFDYQKSFAAHPAELVALSNHAEDDPLSVHIMNYNEAGLKFRFDFNGAYIPGYLADEFMDSLQFVLTHAKTTMPVRLTELSITSEQQLKAAQYLGRGVVRRNEFASFPELWQKQAEFFYSNEAIIFQDQQLTYGQLEQKIMNVAEALKSRQIRRGDRVGVLLDRSIDIVPVILGILEFGAVYVPIDKCFPSERIEYIVNDSSIKLLMTDGQQAISCEQMVVQDFINEDETTYLGSPTLRPTDEAYIIYTSGSTGQPKGVVITHESLVDYCQTFADFFTLTEADRVIQQASFVFDTSVEEIFPILSVGGSLVISENPRDFHQLLEECSRHQVTLLSTNPYVAQYLNENYDQHELSLRIFISGGDALKLSQVDLLANKVAVFNTYGPTESTVCATYHRVTTEDVEMPIGRPITNRSTYVVNGNQVLPQGAIGEIVLGGKGLAKAYLNRPELTQKAFITIAGERVYRTGDLGQWDAAGNLLFHGRKDNQLSFRGYRIEAREIETAIYGSDQKIGNAFVTVREIEGNPTLIAYIVKSGAEQFDTDALQKALRQKLPTYMLPNHIMAVDDLPLNTSGKIDVKRLPLPSGATVQRNITPPSTEIEKELVAAWSELLKVEEIGIHENFFELGGHSLLANQFIGRIRQERRQDISLKTFYGAPTIHELANMLEEQPISNDFSENLKLTKAPEQDLYPLSFPQERLWFLNELNEENKAYYVPRAIKMTGNVDVSLIAKTFTLLTEKHEVLRTQFPIIDGVPYQRIVAPFEFQVPLVSFEHLAGEEQEIAIKEFILEEGNRRFDLSKDPLIRVHVLRRSPQDNILVFCEHHIIHDGWTQGILLREFIDTYEQLTLDRNYRLTPPDLQFKDFTYWQRNYFTTEMLEKHASFWRKKLAGHRALLSLPTKGRRPKLISGKGKLLEFILEDDFARDVRKFSQENNATLFITMLAAFKTTLAYFSRETDICVGAAAANRRLASVSDMLGMIINTLAVRTEFEEDDTLFEIFNKVKESCFETYAFEDTPFDKVVQFTGAERDLSINPIFQYNFSFMNTPSRNLFLPDLELEILDSHNETAKFDINVVVVTPREQSQQEGNNEETVDRIIVEWEYNSDIFTEELMELMMEAYNKFLRLIVGKGELKYSAVDPLESKTKNGLQLKQSDPVAVESVVALFQKRVANQPTTAALVFGETVYNYAQLDEVSNQLALYLRETRGIRQGDIAAIRMERSHWQIISILAIMKLGAAYLPINEQTPDNRVNEVLQDAKATCCLDDELIAKFSGKQSDHLTRYLEAPSPAKAKAEAVGRGSGRGPSGKMSVGRPSNYTAGDFKVAELTADDLAYVIYTSGSTGGSKGVKINHGNLFYSTAARDEVYQNGINFLSLSSISFDSSVAGIFHALCYGNTLHLTSSMDLKDPQYLADYIVDQNIATLLAIPSYAELILKSLRQQPEALQEVIVAGEYCSPDFIDYFHGEEKLQKVALYNEYGPTECTVWASYHKYERGQEVADTIGKAIPGTRAYILDANENILPDGIIGELAIAGPTLSTGYLNRPELTAEKFIALDLADGRQIQVYKTGDLAIKNKDGQLTYKGRKDNQVKIRGYRIELEEIEKELLQHPEVRRAVVTTYAGQSGQLKLRAFFEAADFVKGSDLKTYLGESLPLYMVPAHFQRVEKFATNENGKIDRKALAAMEITVETSQVVTDLAELNDTEARLYVKWQALLEIEQFSIDDDFFELGGTSIQAIYGTKLEELEFPVKYYFQYRTIRKIAEQLDDDSKQEEELLIPLVTDGDEGVNLILVPYAGAMEAAYYQLLDSLRKTRSYNVYEIAAFRNYFSDGCWDMEAFLADARSEFGKLPTGGRFVLYGHCAGTALTMLMAQALSEMEQEVLGVFIGASLFQTTTNAPFGEAEIRELLTNINGNLSLLGEAERQQIIDNFGIDNKIANQIKDAFIRSGQTLPKLNCPIHCIFGEEDQLTENFVSEYRNWGLLNDGRVTHDVISAGNHYFVNEQAELTAQLIINNINGWHEHSK